MTDPRDAQGVAAGPEVGRRGRLQTAIRFMEPGLIRDRIADAIREAIVAGRLKPGERIRERDLVSLLGVSRSPLREATRMLEAEGFLSSVAHRGTWVSELSAADLHDMVQVRVMLETTAARLAIESLDDRTLGLMEDQVRGARTAGRNVNPSANFDLALGFHDLLVQASRNRKMVHLHGGLKLHQRRYQHFAFARIGADLRAVDEHAEILEALRRRNVPAAESVLKSHLLRFYEEIAPLLPPGDREAGERR